MTEFLIALVSLIALGSLMFLAVPWLKSLQVKYKDSEFVFTSMLLSMLVKSAEQIYKDSSKSGKEKFSYVLNTAITYLESQGVTITDEKKKVISSMIEAIIYEFKNSHKI